jgi:hypothetical protein
MVLIIEVELVYSGNIRMAWIKEWGPEIFKWFRPRFITLLGTFKDSAPDRKIDGYENAGIVMEEQSGLIKIVAIPRSYR